MDGRYAVSLQVIEHDTGRTAAYVNLYRIEPDEDIMMRSWQWNMGPNEGMPVEGEDFLVEVLGSVIGHIAGE